MSFDILDLLGSYFIVLIVASVAILFLGCLYWPKDKERRSDE